uniref:JmjC domain-containing protein n=1 Tax=Panagrolaimus sp. JU765 TaxID=591449 RepID=A0AC34RAH6_9BILA
MGRMRRNKHVRRRVEELANRAKKLVRPELKLEDWNALQLSSAGLKGILRSKDIEFSVDPSVELFQRYYKGPGQPALVLGIVDKWPAYRKWTFDWFEKKFRNQFFKIGEDDHGKAVKMRMKYFVVYMENNSDDAPLNIFDSTFGEREVTRKLLADYTEPKYFAKNWFKFCDPSRTPPNRWLVIGPARSGTGIHVDPMGTSAWNALLQGEKLWVLFPPDTPKKLLRIPKNAKDKTLGEEAIRWFRCVYPETQKESWPYEYRPTVHVQRRGELIFVPSGWWHVVLNLSDTVAVTENFCDESNFLNCYRATRRSRPKFCEHWLNTIRRCHPEAVGLFPSIFGPSVNEGNESESSTSESSSSSDDECEVCQTESGKESLVSSDSSDESSSEVSRKRMASSSSGPESRRHRQDEDDE